jgi:hypothetical protein
MTNNRALPILAVLALGLAFAAPAAWAQSGPAKPATLPDPSVAPPQPDAVPASANSVEGVNVTAQRTRPELDNIPPEKRAQFDAEAARQKAWQDYRKGPIPKLTDNPNDDGQSYPGLNALLPQQ